MASVRCSFVTGSLGENKPQSLKRFLSNFNVVAIFMAVFLPQNHAICIQRHLLSTSFCYSDGFARLCCHCQHDNGRCGTKGLGHFTRKTLFLETIWREKDRHFPFLDLNVSRGVQGNLEASVYRKPSHTDKYLAFDSHHPI